MNKRAIFVMAYSRPKYLYVCLDSVKRCHEVSGWDVWVSFDNGPAAADHRICHGLLPFQAMLHDRPLGNRDHPTEILRRALHFGYERVLFAEDDMLFGPGLLTWVHSREPGWTGTISTWSRRPQHLDELAAHMSSAPCSLSAAHAAALVEFMDSKAYIGEQNVCNGEPITPGVTYDVCWYAWCRKVPVLCRFSPVQLSFNFGFNGMHYKNSRFESRAFAGPPAQWLLNVTALSRDPEFAGLTRTPGFAAP